MIFLNLNRRAVFLFVYAGVALSMESRLQRLGQETAKALSSEPNSEVAIESTRNLLEALKLNDRDAIEKMVPHNSSKAAILNLAASFVGPADLITAIENGQDVHALALLQDENIDPSAGRNQALWTAAAHGNLKITRALLSHPHFYAGDMDSDACILAAKGGHLDVLIFLLQNVRIRCFTNMRQCLFEAAKADRAHVVEYLLKNSCIDPATENNRLIQELAMNGGPSVIKFLLRDTRVNPVVAQNNPMNLAVRYGNAGAVSALLEDPRVKAVTSGFGMFDLAVKLGHAEVVRLFVNDPSVDEEDINYSIVEAAASNHIGVVKILLQHSWITNFYIAIECRHYKLLSSVLAELRRFSTKNAFKTENLSVILQGSLDILAYRFKADAEISKMVFEEQLSRIGVTEEMKNAPEYEILIQDVMVHLPINTESLREKLLDL